MPRTSMGPQLMHSVIESDAQMIALLLKSGATINAHNALGSTALMQSIWREPAFCWIVERMSRLKARVAPLR